MNKYYNKKYFDQHKEIGIFGGRANLIKFEEFVKKSDKVIDFGCGGGYLLNNIVCREKIGIEINQAARKEAKALGIKVVSDPNTIRDSWADVIISNNVLEHVENPLATLRKLYGKLKKRGKIIFIVPCESVDNLYAKGDIDQHLYSWSPKSAGNLFERAGFKVKESKSYYHRWPKNYQFVAAVVGERLFQAISFLNGKINKSLVQIRIVGIK